MDSKSLSKDADWRLYVPERSLETPFGVEARYHDRGGVET